MFPYYWGGTPVSGAAGMTFSNLLESDLGLGDLPEEVRAALEERQEEIHTAEDARRIAEELMLRR